jgi:hypothetical protein
LATKLESRRILEVALGADQRERRGALTAKFHSVRIFESRILSSASNHSEAKPLVGLL